MYKLELHDPGLDTQVLDALSLDKVFQLLEYYNMSYTSAFVSYKENNVMVMNMYRELGDRNWKVVFRSNQWQNKLRVLPQGAV